MIFVYYGENSFLIQEKLSAIKSKYQQKFSSSLNFWKIDLEENIENLKSIVDSQSMFEEKKLLFLRGVFSVSESKWEEVKKNIQSALNSSEVILVFYDFLVPKDATKKRLDFLSNIGKSEEFKNFEKTKFINWILDRSKLVGLKIGRPEAEYLANNIGTDLYRANSEIFKLASYKNGNILTKKDIDYIVPFDVYINNFGAIDAILNKNSFLALKNLEEQWMKNEDPVKILGAFSWQFRILLRLYDLKYSSFEDASKKLGIPAWSIKKSANALKKFSFVELKNIYQELVDIDLAIKTGAEDGKEALRDFVCRFGSL